MFFSKKYYICKQKKQKKILNHQVLMKSIQINVSKTQDDLTGKSKWWGSADLPEGMTLPMIPFEDGDDDPMTLVCQIRCADLAAVDPDNLLPHTGMLYFFAAIDEYVGALHKERYNDDEEEEPYDEEEVTDEEEISDEEEEFDAFDYEEDSYHNGIGEWPKEAFKVIYSPIDQDLKTHQVIGPDGEPYALPAEKITFGGRGKADQPAFKLLGDPYYDEVGQWYPEYINLLQIDENDDWAMRFYDCGMINFLIKPEDLEARRFENVIVYFHSL